MTFPEDDDLVEKLPPTRPDPPFRKGVLPRTPVRRAHRLGTEPANGCRDVGGEDRVAIVGEEARRSVERKGLSELLDHPRCGGIRRDVEVNDSSPAVVDHEPDVEKLKAVARPIRNPSFSSSP